jgi:hypothetical protein
MKDLNKHMSILDMVSRELISMSGGEIRNTGRNRVNTIDTCYGLVKYHHKAVTLRFMPSI